MAVGDQNDVAGRIWGLLPSGWFGRRGDSPIVEALAQGGGWALSNSFSLYAAAKALTRIATMTGGWLEFAAGDYFDQFNRLSGEGDTSYARRIRLEVFRPRNTRYAIDRAVFDLTATHPTIVETWRPGDCGGWGTTAFAFGGPGIYGSRATSYDVLIFTPQPTNYGIPNRGGWGSYVGAYGTPANFSFADANDIVGSGASQADILSALERVRTAGITYWVQFTVTTPPPPGPGTAGQPIGLLLSLTKAS